MSVAEHLGDRRHDGALVSQAPVQNRSQLPAKVPATSKWNVWYSESYIRLGNTRALSELFQTCHSGIIMRCETSLEGYNCPREMTFEYFALYFPLGAVLPTIRGGTEQEEEEEESSKSTTTTSRSLEWHNDACVGYSNTIEEERWEKAQLYVGHVQGDTLNAYFDWIIIYTKRKPGYQLFDVWDRPELGMDTVEYVKSNVCSTFSEESLAFMHAHGASFRHDVMIFRNYIPLLTTTAPECVDMNNKEQHDAVIQFYTSMQEAVNMNVSLAEFLETIAHTIRVFYVYNDKREYMRVTLASPYIVMSALYQPMRTPWTGVVIPLTTSPLHSTGRELFRFGEAVGGFARLVVSRAPDIIAKRAMKNFPKLATMFAFVVALLAIVIFCIGGSSGITFILGFCIGVLSSTVFFRRYLGKSSKLPTL